MAGDHRLSRSLETHRATEAAADTCFRSLTIWEKALGPDHTNVGTILDSLASLYIALGCYGDAEPLYMRSLAIWEDALGPDHPDHLSRQPAAGTAN